MQKGLRPGDIVNLIVFIPILIEGDLIAEGIKTETFSAFPPLVAQIEGDLIAEGIKTTAFSVISSLSTTIIEGDLIAEGIKTLSGRSR